MASPLETPALAVDLISFLKALPDCRLHRGIRYLQWWMPLVAILSILSNQWGCGARATARPLADAHMPADRLAQGCFEIEIQPDTDPLMI